jgi:hypothetical protein
MASKYGYYIKGGKIYFGGDEVGTYDEEDGKIRLKEGLGEGNMKAIMKAAQQAGHYKPGDSFSWGNQNWQEKGGEFLKATGEGGDLEGELEGQMEEWKAERQRIAEGYGDIQEHLRGYGEQMGRDVDIRAAKSEAGMRYRMGRAGMGHTTVPGQMSYGIERERMAEQRRVGEHVQGMMTRPMYGGLGFRERSNIYPDYRFYGHAAGQQGYGQGQTWGGKGSGGSHWGPGGPPGGIGPGGIGGGGVSYGPPEQDYTMPPSGGQNYGASGGAGGVYYPPPGDIYGGGTGQHSGSGGYYDYPDY